MDTKLALRPQQAAEAIGVSRAKLYELLAAGVVKSVRIGGVRLVPVAELQRLVEVERA